MDKLNDENLSAVRASLALAAERLGEASATLASSAAPMLGGPTIAAPPAAMPMAKQLSANAAPLALSAPMVSRSIPTLSRPI